MTLAGKILVFLNLVFACLFLGFSVSVFQSRENYQKLRLEDAVKLADANKATAKEKAVGDELAAKLRTAESNLENQRKDTNAAREQLRNESARLNAELDKQKLELAPTSARVENMGDEMKRRAEEVVTLRENRSELVKKNAALMDQLTASKDQVAQLRNDLEVLKDRNDTMSKEGNQVVVWLASKGMTMPPPEDRELASVPNPPPPEVKGIVRKVDGNYIQISLGADDGIKNGQILHVWRSKPQPKYIGTAKVTLTESNTAVAKPLSMTGGPVLKNDEVGPNSLINR